MSSQLNVLSDFGAPPTRTACDVKLRAVPVGRREPHTMVVGDLSRQYWSALIPSRPAGSK